MTAAITSKGALEAEARSIARTLQLFASRGIPAEEAELIRREIQAEYDAGTGRCFGADGRRVNGPLLAWYERLCELVEERSEYHDLEEVTS